MKCYLRTFAGVILGLSLLPAHAQFGPTPGGPDFSGPMAKLFEKNPAFSAALEVQTTDSASNIITMPGKFSFDAGKSRFELNIGDVQSKQLPPTAAAQMKSMGLDQMVMIARPDKKVAYLVYPGMQSYVETGLAKAESPVTNEDYKVETTELGKETVDGHRCVKNKVVVTGQDGGTYESIVWNATDLKNFPVKIIQAGDGGANTTMTFKSVSLAKPASSLFEAPPGYTKYDSMQTMVQQQLMKRMNGGNLPGGMGTPPGN